MSNTVQNSGFTGPLVIDPVTRLEGHLRIELEVEKGKVSNAYSSITLFRGLEVILKGRNPLDAQHFAQRTCGVCTYTHALASLRALEDALKVTLPPLAVQIRNLVLGAQIMHDHVVHFYHLHALDFVNVANCLKADPSAAAKILAARPGNTKKQADIAKELSAVKDRIKKFVDSGQLGPFTSAYFLNDAGELFLLPAEVDLIATAHYLEALEIQRKIARAMAIFGGKNPHTQFTVAGGVTCYESLKPEPIKHFTELISEATKFMQTSYLQDALAIASVYKNEATYGGTSNFMSFGEFASNPNDPATEYFKDGVIYNKDYSKVVAFDANKIAEDVRHSWYKGSEPLTPYKGTTEPEYTGLHGDERYSWSKAPRYGKEPMETGPLAHLFVAYGHKHKDFAPLVDVALNTLGIKLEDLNSTIGRTAARAIETNVIAGKMDTWINEFKEALAKEKEPKIATSWEMPNEAEGVGFVNAPRGGLSHWMRIEDKKIANYQLVVPTTWNGSPRCSNNKIGPMEEALIGVPVKDPKRPVEVLRTIHSFDPCLACAVHVIDPESNEKREFKIL